MDTQYPPSIDDEGYVEQVAQKLGIEPKDVFVRVYGNEQVLVERAYDIWESLGWLLPKVREFLAVNIRA